ncbi:hypothetical protein [Nocardia sp. NPDC003345]
MRRILETAAVAAAAAVTVLAIPLSAHAAGGVFTTEDTQGGTSSSTTLENPEDGKCYLVEMADSAINRTDTPVTLYDSEDCERGSEVVLLPPGGEEYGLVPFVAVKFGD